MGVPELVLPKGLRSLEIGLTLPSRTWWHLEQDGAVWRWRMPGSTELTLLASVGLGPEGWMVTTLSYAAELRAGQHST